MEDLIHEVDVTLFSRGEILVQLKKDDSVLFSIPAEEVEEDINLQECTDEELTQYVVSYYSEYISDLIYT